MAAASIQIANPANLQKIESFFNDSSYREAIENSCTFNTRLCVERRQRMPFLDPQTGVAQNHCTLFMKKRQRMPGMREGQIYTYPAARWRKARRQYLTQQHRPFGIIREPGEIETEVNSVSNQENPELNNTDSKDSQNMKEEVPKEWFYDEQELLEMEGFEDPDPDSDYDYDESYSKRRRRRSGKGSRGGGGLATTDSPQTKRGRSSAGAGRGRRKAQPAPPYEVMGDADKPFGCELCGARYKTRPGLTYHYTHSHKEPMSDGDSRDSASAKTATGAPVVAGVQSGVVPVGTAPAVPNPNAVTTPPTSGSGSPTPPSEVPSGVVTSKVAPVAPVTDTKGVDPKAGPSTEYQDSYVTFLNNPAGAPIRRGRPGPPSLPPNTGASPLSNPDDPTMPVLTPEQKIPESDSDTERPIPKGPAEKGKAAPSPYCDFCLGDHRENKKTMTPEELVSCSDCGRSGHPTCLQFTANMIISVRKYRWQCIECKCCSICGNSDNDDQLLFCDDCDRGYHMYCLAPPLATPPEGSWSCRLCIEEFHK